MSMSGRVTNKTRLRRGGLAFALVVATILSCSPSAVAAGPDPDAPKGVVVVYPGERDGAIVQRLPGAVSDGSGAPGGQARESRCTSEIDASACK